MQVLDEKGALRPGLNVSRATDILWTLNHPNLYRLRVDDRGWTPDQHERGDLLCFQLLERANPTNPASVAVPRLNLARRPSCGRPR